MKRTEFKNFESNVKVKNYPFGKFYTYYNPLQKINIENPLIFFIHPNISFDIFIQDTKYNLLSTQPSIVQGFYDKYQVKLLTCKTTNPMLELPGFNQFTQFKATNTKPRTKETIYISVTEYNLLNRPARPCQVQIVKYYLLGSLMKFSAFTQL